MSLSGAVAYRGSAPRATIAVNIPAVLAGFAFGALALTTMFGTLSALVFLLCGAMLMAFNVVRSTSAMLRWWFIFLFPAYCMLSVLWSDFPALTLRHAIQLSLTIAIAVVIAERVSSPTLRNILFITHAIGVLLSLVFRNYHTRGELIGIFASKNAFSVFVALFILVSASFVLDRECRPAMRITALIAGLGCFPVMLMAQSAGTLLTIFPCVAIMVVVAFNQYLSGPQKLFLILFTLLGAAGVGVFAILNLDMILELILDSTGKDVTLTGRTDLWDIAAGLIAERPLLGAGYRAFWVIGHEPAEQLWRMFNVSSGAGFSFHNLYISNAVDVGILGVAMQVALIYAAFAMLIWLAIVRPTANVALWLGIHTLLVQRSFIETDVFFEFSIASILAITALIYAWHNVLAWRAENPAPGPIVAKRSISPFNTGLAARSRGARREATALGRR